MIAHDTVKNIDVEVDRDSLIQMMRDGRQVDFVMDHPVYDDDGYVCWDVEFWSALSDEKFIRTYALNGKTLREFTHYNIYDMAGKFRLERAKEIRIS